MKIVRSLAQIQAITLRASKDSKIGFVPTMGYLHRGHLSLVQKAKSECDIVVVSIFVNPAQFGPKEDLAKYPRDLDRDLAMLKDLGVDYVFVPDGKKMYPPPYKTWVEVKGLSDVLCGASRPGHFVGVATIVLKLVNLVNAHFMYMGEKDFQQIAVLKTMLNDLNHPCKIISCPIIRESDGLAMSSRNIYLSALERQNATCLSQAIKEGQRMYESGEKNSIIIINAMRDIILKAGLKPDYISCVDSNSLKAQRVLRDNSRIILAAFAGKTRLIDNASIISQNPNL